MPLNVAILAAGAGGMYCGSCIRDHTLASALIREGHQATLVPLYTPIRTDEPNISVKQVFYGGVNVYLQYATRLFRHTPRFFDWLFDRPWLLRWAGNAGAQSFPAKLGPFILSILRGDHGPQLKELRRLIEFLRKHVKPDVVVLPNAMFLGLAGMIRSELGCRIVCELTGEDIFLDAMVEPWATRARDLMRSCCPAISRFVATSRYYQKRMSNYLNIPADSIEVVYPGVERTVLEAPDSDVKRDGRTIGYFARICPEKGLAQLVEAFAILRARPAHADARLVAAGYLGAANHKWFEALRSRIDNLGLDGAFHFRGEVDLAGKIHHLQSIDVLSSPAPYAEPKGIYVLESLARGTPFVQPAHGAFPEILEQTGGGLLVNPGDPEALANSLATLLANPDQRRSLGDAGRKAVREKFTDVRMAREMARVFAVK